MIFSATVKFHPTDYFYDAKVAGLGKISRNAVHTIVVSHTKVHVSYLQEKHESNFPHSTSEYKS